MEMQEIKSWKVYNFYSCFFSFFIGMNFKALHIHGEVRTDLLHRILYSTDASAYREMPLAVAFPKDETDVQEIVRYASKNHINLIPRAGGTSLAGQVVGKGLVVNISRYMNQI